MGKNIEPLSITDEREIRELLKTADKSLSTKDPVLTEGSAASSLVGSVIGGAYGAALLTGGVATVAPLVGGAALGAGAGVAIGGVSLLGGSIVGGILFPPAAIVGIIAAGVSYILGRKKRKQEVAEQRKQANYCKELSEKMNKLYEKHRQEMEKKDAIIRENEETIRKQQEKIMEYELIFEAMKKKYDSMAENFA